MSLQIFWKTSLFPPKSSLLWADSPSLFSHLETILFLQSLLLPFSVPSLQKTANGSRLFRMSAAVLTVAYASSLYSGGISTTTRRHPWHVTTNACTTPGIVQPLSNPAPAWFWNYKIKSSRCTQGLMLCLKARRYLSESTYTLLKISMKIHWWLYQCKNWIDTFILQCF